MNLKMYDELFKSKLLLIVDDLARFQKIQHIICRNNYNTKY